MRVLVLCAVLFPLLIGSVASAQIRKGLDEANDKIFETRLKEFLEKKVRKAVEIRNLAKTCAEESRRTLEILVRTPPDKRGTAAQRRELNKMKRQLLELQLSKIRDLLMTVAVADDPIRALRDCAKPPT